jgi:hypothetical protein
MNRYQDGNDDNCYQEIIKRGFQIDSYKGEEKPPTVQIIEVSGKERLKMGKKGKRFRVLGVWF